MNRKKGFFNTFYGIDGPAAEQGVKYPALIRRLGAIAVVPGTLLVTAGLVGTALGIHSAPLLEAGIATDIGGAVVYGVGEFIDSQYVPDEPIENLAS